MVVVVGRRRRSSLDLDHLLAAKPLASSRDTTTHSRIHNTAREAIRAIHCQVWSVTRCLSSCMACTLPEACKPRPNNDVFDGARHRCREAFDSLAGEIMSSLPPLPPLHQQNHQIMPCEIAVPLPCDSTRYRQPGTGLTRRSERERWDGCERRTRLWLAVGRGVVWAVGCVVAGEVASSLPEASGCIACIARLVVVRSQTTTTLHFQKVKLGCG